MRPFVFGGDMINNVSVWLDQTADRFSDKVGFGDENVNYSFSMIREKSLKIAYEIVKQGLFRKPIAILMEKSADCLIAFMAVAYSGNFYCPIDIDMPLSRKQKIVECLQPELFISKEKYKNEIKNSLNGEVLLYEEVLSSDKKVDIDAVYQQRDKCCDTDLLYVLFTSGSTGVPKGVTISHKSVIDYIDCIQEVFHIDETVTWGNQAPFYFDNSVLDIYSSIKTGASLEIIPKGLFSWPIKLIDYIIEKKINSIFWVPSEMIIVSKLKALDKYKLDGRIKRILFCGEVMPCKCLNYWKKSIPSALYANLYGPTEITDACTYYIVDRNFDDDEPLPIGKPFKNTDVMLLNDQDEIIEEYDQIGEICVRGSSLSFGYYNNKEKTNQVFIQNPLNDRYNEYIYRTGDLGKYNSFGEIIYLARKDFQIKHMGHRIELGEIETMASAVEGIAMSCCLYDDKRRRIVMFYEGDTETNKLICDLRDKLPDYMVPSKVIAIDNMPLNINGKIDRVKLKEAFLK